VGTLRLLLLLTAQRTPPARKKMAQVIFARKDQTAADDSDDEGTLQRPAFLVTDGEMGDERVPPGDGLEYLRRVRSQQQQLPAVVRVTVDPDRIQKATARRAASSSHTPTGTGLGATLAALAAMPSSTAPLPPAQLPRAAWQRQLLADFAALSTRAQRLPRAGGSHAMAADGCSRPGCGSSSTSNAASSSGTGSGFPDTSDVTGWAAWTLGRGGANGTGRAPTLHLMSQLDQARTLGLLRSLQLMLTRAAARKARDEKDEDGAPGEDRRGKGWGGFHAADGDSSTMSVDAPSRWIYAAFARLDKTQLDADACATVRAIFTACIQLRAQMLNSERSEERDGAGTPSNSSEIAALNVLITIAGGFFGQAPTEDWLGVEEEGEG
jgi:CheY-like chemotaxis protein